MHAGPLVHLCLDSPEISRSVCYAFCIPATSGMHMDSATTLSTEATWHEAMTAAARAWDAKLERLGPNAWPHPRVVAERAERIYAQRYQVDYEQRHHGQFVAIDIDTERAYIGATAKEAWLKGLRASLTATLFLVRVGFPAAFELKGRYRYACRSGIS
jgi:hypothetical protein